MLSITETPNGNLEVSTNKRKEFKQRTEFRDDPEELLSELIYESGYYSHKVKEGLPQNQFMIEYAGQKYLFNENKCFVREINKYGFIIFVKV